MRFLIGVLFHFAILLILPSIAAQEFIAISDSGFVNPKQVEIHSNGDVFVVGWFGGTADFNPNGNRIALAAESQDAFMAKYRDGSCLWAINMGGPYQDIGYSLAIGSDGVYIGGTFKQSAEFDAGTGESVLTADDHAGFLAKYEFEGNLVWATTVGSSVYDMTVDGSGDVLVTGHDKMGIGYVARYDAGGVHLGMHTLGGTGLGIHADAGAIFVTGWLGTDERFVSSDFDPSNDEAVLTTKGASDMYVAAFRPFGAFDWAFLVGGNMSASGTVPNGLVWGNRIASDPRGNLYVAGQFGGGYYRHETGGTIDFDPGRGAGTLTSTSPSDAFVVKYDTAGSYQWASNIGGAGDNRPTDIAVAVDGSVYLAKTGVIAKLDHDTGSFAWKVNVSGNPSAVSLANDGRVVVAGWLDGQSDFDPGPGIKPLEGRGAYLVEYDADGTVSVGVESNLPGPTTHSEMSLYPNPATTNVSLSLAIDEAQFVNVHVFDLLGRAVRDAQSRFCSHDCNLGFDLSDFPSGVYLMRIEGEHFVSTRQVVVQR